MEVARLPQWVIFDQVIELGETADVRFDPDSNHDRTALQYLAKGQQPTFDISSSFASRNHVAHAVVNCLLCSLDKR
jgi:hypothetical protein